MSFETIPVANRWEVRRLNELLQRAGLLPQSGRDPQEVSSVSSGAPALDRLLPERGFRRGSLVEWLGDSPGSGASTLGLIAAREAHAEGGAVVIIDRAGTFYPPAAAAWQLDLGGVILVRPANDKDAEWALDQSLRCEHVAAVLAWPRRLDSHAFRRLQLAAEQSGAVGHLVRPAAARREPSWADVRLAVTPRASSSGGWQLGVRLLRVRGRLGREAEIVVEIDEHSGDIHETHPRYLAAELADPATHRQQA